MKKTTPIALAAALLALTSVASAQEGIDRIFAILTDDVTLQSSIVKVETDGNSILSVQTVADIPGTAAYHRANRNALAYLNMNKYYSVLLSSAGLPVPPGIGGDEWQLLFIDQLSPTTFTLNAYSSHHGYLGASDVQTFAGGNLHSGAFNYNPNLFSGVGYYYSASTETGADLYSLTTHFDPGTMEFVGALNVTSINHPGGLGWGDFDFHDAGMIGSVGAINTVSPEDGTSGVFSMDNDHNLTWLPWDNWRGQLAYSEELGNWYTAGAVEGNSLGVTLSKINPWDGSTTVIGNITDTGDWLVLDLAGDPFPVIPVPEPSSALLACLAGTLALLRRRRAA